jgi:hypothetical protein
MIMTTHLRLRMVLALRPRLSWGQLVAVPGVEPSGGRGDVGCRLHGSPTLLLVFVLLPATTGIENGREGYFLGVHDVLLCGFAQVRYAKPLG